MRKSGWYWVKQAEWWAVMLWDSEDKQWFASGCEYPSFTDHDMEEINENMIKEPQDNQDLDISGQLDKLFAKQSATKELTAKLWGADLGIGEFDADKLAKKLIDIGCFPYCN